MRSREPRPRPIRYRPSESLGRVHTSGQASRIGGDAYFALLTTPFWRFCLVVALFVLAINSLFAWVYLLDPGGITNTRVGSFEDAFFFSVQTFATIGYGTMAPQTRFAHVVVTLESILGILSVGSLAGIAFARLSRPEARVLFSDKLVVRPRNGLPHLQIRLANWRTNLIVEASLRLFVLVPERTAEGEVLRTPLELKLVRGSTPVFFLTWTAMHAIDETSPFFGPDAQERLRAAGAQLFAMLTGYDQTLGQMAYAYREYKFDDIVQGARFVDVVEVRPDGARHLDFSRFHETEPLNEAEAHPEAKPAEARAEAKGAKQAAQ
jgi:inward rectifier potassium channel